MIHYNYEYYYSCCCRLHIFLAYLSILKKTLVLSQRLQVKHSHALFVSPNCVQHLCFLTLWSRPAPKKPKLIAGCNQFIVIIGSVSLIKFLYVSIKWHNPQTCYFHNTPSCLISFFISSNIKSPLPSELVPPYVGFCLEFTLWLPHLCSLLSLLTFSQIIMYHYMT